MFGGESSGAFSVGRLASFLVRGKEKEEGGGGKQRPRETMLSIPIKAIFFPSPLSHFVLELLEL